MHIPENYLSPQTCAVLTAAMVPAWIISARRVKRELPAEEISMLGVGAAFTFVGMMFNVPLPGGTTGHAVGGTLIAALLGPHAACVCISVSLLLQALMFGDGGILSFGANCFNIALVMPFVGYALYRLLLRLLPKKKISEYLSLGIASYAGINAAALCAAIEFGIQPMLFRDASGSALYCPYGLPIAVPAMMIGHLTIFGLAEVIFSIAVYAFLRRTDPGIIAAHRGQASAGSQNQQRMIDAPDKRHMSSHTGSRAFSAAANVLLSLLIILTPLGLLAQGTAWGEWSIEDLRAMTGFTPAGMNSLSWSSLIPDYLPAGLPPIFGYVLSAVFGCAVLMIVFKLFSAARREKHPATQRGKITRSMIPEETLSESEMNPRTGCPVIPLLLTLLCILLSALARNNAFTVVLITAELTYAAFLPVIKLRRVFTALILPVLFSVLILLPSIFLGNPKTMLSVTLKVAQAVLVLGLLRSAVPWQDITDALRALHLPAAFVMVLDQTLRFLTLLDRCSTTLREAVQLRTGKKTNWRRSGMGGVMGVTYLKARRMSDATQEAMRLRGLQEAIRTPVDVHISSADVLRILAMLALLIFYFFTHMRYFNQLVF